MARTYRWSPRTGWSWSLGACEVGSSLDAQNLCPCSLPRPTGHFQYAAPMGEKASEVLICEDDQKAKLLGRAWPEFLRILSRPWEGS